MPGLFDLLGLIRHVQLVNELPFPVSLVAFSEVQFDPGAADSHILKVTVYSPANVQIASVIYSITVDSTLNSMNPTIVNFSVGSKGTYRIDLGIDDRKVDEKFVVVDIANSVDPKRRIGFGYSQGGPNA